LKLGAGVDGWKRASIVGVVVLFLAGGLFPAASILGGTHVGPAVHVGRAPLAPLDGGSPSDQFSTPVAPSPHPGSLEVYETGIQTTEDPAVADDSVSEEAILNVYQTLITYNGSSTSNFVPELSACVPGTTDGSVSTASVSCQAVYGSSLVVDNGAGLPQYFTFPIDSAARFYDPATGNSWPVFPSDVMFSLARTLGFSTQPAVASQPGWIEAQALLPAGNASWDGGVHAPYNNTPQAILASMLVNDSTYCPSAALAASGCITFDADGSGASWPYFMALLADPLGDSIVPCGWFTYENATVPGFSGTTAADGDGPCLLPSNATSTSQSGFQNYLSATGPTAWDSFEGLAQNTPSVQPNVMFDLVGSGPFYIAPGGDNPIAGYTLRASPAYHQPSGCVGVGGGCEPSAGGYMSKVEVAYEYGTGTGLAAYAAGTADEASTQPADFGAVLTLEAAGHIGATTVTNFATDPQAFTTEIDTSATQSDSGILTTIPANFFSFSGLRQFFAQSFPYASYLGDYTPSYGFSTFQGVGGAIPSGLGNYYPTNISWPGLNRTSGQWQNPDLNPNDTDSAAWWWANLTNPLSPFYDAEATACKTSTCLFVMGSQSTDPALDEAINDWNLTVSSITGGAIDFTPWDLSSADELGFLTGAPGTNPLPTSLDAQLPDYADPSDYTGAYYQPGGLYAEASGFNATFVAEDYGGSYLGCTAFSTNNFTNLAHWAKAANAIRNSCQGTALRVMNWALTTADQLPLGTERALYYNLAEHVANHLALYAFDAQQTDVETYASWIDPATVNTNPMIGGAGVQTWYSWGYDTNVANDAPAVANLLTVYSQRPDLETAFPQANSNFTNFTDLITWAGSASIGLHVDSDNSTLEPFGYFYAMMMFYNQRPDLQAAFPNAYTDSTSYADLVGWAADAITGASSDGAGAYLEPYGYYYLLMNQYDQRSDLQAAFPNSYSNATSFAALVSWAASVVTGSSTDGAGSYLSPFGYYYELMATYNARPDLEAAFPNAFTNYTGYTGLISWAESVVTGVSPDGANASLQPFGWYYALLGTYNERPDLQLAFPSAYSNLTNFQGLLSWAANVVSGASSDGAGAILAPFGYYYYLLQVYDERSDLQAAFPFAFTSSSAYAGLVSWAETAIASGSTDGAGPYLQAYGYYYALFGVYNVRPDLQSAFPSAQTSPASYSGLLAWAKNVVDEAFSDGAYSTLVPYKSYYDANG
jgi:hypothetical protein